MRSMPLWYFKARVAPKLAPKTGSPKTTPQPNPPNSLFPKMAPQNAPWQYVPNTQSPKWYPETYSPIIQKQTDLQIPPRNCIHKIDPYRLHPFPQAKSARSKQPLNAFETRTHHLLLLLLLLLLLILILLETRNHRRGRSRAAPHYDLFGAARGRPPQIIFI